MGAMVMRRTLSRFDITCLGLNAIVGSGIFLLPDDLYRELGVLSPLAFVCSAWSGSCRSRGVTPPQPCGCRLQRRTLCLRQ